jgi:hypothetical protein
MTVNERLESLVHQIGKQHEYVNGVHVVDIEKISNALFEIWKEADQIQKSMQSVVA